MVKGEHTTTGVVNTRTKMNDFAVRLIGIPAFGIAIPNLTGLFGDLLFNDFKYWLGYLYFIGLAFFIWQGNRWLLFRQRKYWDWFSKPVIKLMMLVSANVFYTFPLTVGWLTMWYLMLGWPVNWEVIRLVTLANVICVIFVTHGYETVFLIKERNTDQVRIANTEKARALSELEALKNQIDPHFMFNSLNTLSFLIEDKPEKALRFADKLADVYRYILKSKDRNLVWLSEEVEFLQNYVFLMQLRFGSDIKLKLQGSIEMDHCLVPPISLQLLAENAIKHNQFSTSTPLCMELQLEQSSLAFTNNRIPKEEPVPSAKMGLKNLAERYQLLVEKPIEINQTNKAFGVKLPVVWV